MSNLLSAWYLCRTNQTLWGFANCLGAGSYPFGRHTSKSVLAKRTLIQMSCTWLNHSTSVSATYGVVTRSGRKGWCHFSGRSTRRTRCPTLVFGENFLCLILYKSSLFPDAPFFTARQVTRSTWRLVRPQTLDPDRRFESDGPGSRTGQDNSHWLWPPHGDTDPASGGGPVSAVLL